MSRRFSPIASLCLSCMRTPQIGFSSVLLSAFLGGLFVARAAADEAYTLQEQSSEGRIDSVECRVSVSGTAEFALEMGKSLVHPISANAVLKYGERRLSGAGRDAESLRSLRRYESLESEIKVADHLTTSRLRNDRRQIVAQGRREGILFYSPQGELMGAELELLRAPADSLTLLGLLPSKPVAIGEKWNPPSWVGQMLTDTEAASKSELTCTLDSVGDAQAKVKFEGTVEGATTGSTAVVQIQGWFLFDLNAGRIAHAEVEQSEKRTVGPVSPGMKVAAKAVVDRKPAAHSDELTDAIAETIPLDPTPNLLQLRFHAPWNVEFDYGRDWHIFQQFPQVAVLRLIEKGSFVAQCNLAPVRHATPGDHVPEEKFLADIRESLGERLKSIDKGEIISTGDNRFLYRVVVAGEANKVPVTWIYYLCAAPDGSQVSFVFAVETSLRERLGTRDLDMLKSLRFLEPPKPPEKIVSP